MKFKSFEEMREKYPFLTPEGKILFRQFLYKDEVYVKYNQVKEVIAFLDMLDELPDEEEEKLKKKIRNLEFELEKAKKREEKLKEELEEQKEIVADYHRYYGSYFSPHQLLNKLFQGVRMKYQLLTPKDKLGIKINKKQYEYWVNVFLDLKICRKNNLGQLVANCTRAEAHEKLFSFNPELNKDILSSNDI